MPEKTDTQGTQDELDINLRIDTDFESFSDEELEVAFTTLKDWQQRLINRSPTTRRNFIIKILTINRAMFYQRVAARNPEPVPPAWDSTWDIYRWNWEDNFLDFGAVEM